jgi:Cu2+-exporting ATPase
MILTIPVIVLSETIQSFVNLSQTIEFPYEEYIQFVFAALITVYGGKPFFKGLYKEISKKSPGMMTLIALAVAVAFIYSSMVVFGLKGRIFFWELATLIDVMLLGHWIEMKSVQAASGSLEELVKKMPDKANKIKENGQTEQVRIDQLQKGDKVLVKPGEKIPIDGTITEGNSRINQAMVTGESEPVEKKENDEVIAGTINGQSALTIEVQKTGQETYLSQVVDMVEKARSSKSNTQNIADKAAFALTIIAVSVAVITLIVWLIAGKQFDYSLERSVTVMITTCPHALGLAIPLVVAVSTALAASKGLLVRNRNSFEAAKDLDAVVFDKTGTLTQGSFKVNDVSVLGEEYSSEQILALAGAIEKNSEHPIGSAVIAHCRDNDIQTEKASGFQAIAGKGAEAEVDDKNVKVVSPNYLKENNIQYDDENLKSKEDDISTRVFVLLNDKPVGVISVADEIRPQAKKAVDALKKMNIKVLMITGDAEKVASAVAKKLELDDYFAEVLPDKKSEKISELQNQNLSVAMVGDGINDAPALAQADVGIAIGAGTDVAIDSADVVLVKSNPQSVVDVISLSGKTFSKMVQNLWWAAGYNIIAIPLAAGVLFWTGFILKPAVGAVVMSLSTVIVAINAQTLKLKF